MPCEKHLDIRMNVLESTDINEIIPTCVHVYIGVIVSIDIYTCSYL